MLVSIVKIGNSRGIRIPKKLLELTNMTDKVDLTIKNGVIYLTPIDAKRAAAVTPELLLAESSLAKDWNRPEEDEAWAYLQ